MGLECCSAVGRDADEHHVRLRRVDLEAADAGEPGGEALGVGMILGEPLDVVLEGVEPGRGDDARLPHRTAQDLAGTLRALDHGPGSDQHRPGRRAEPLGQAHRHRVETAAELGHRRPELHRGVEDARAVEVRREAAPLRQRDRGREIRPPEDAAADRVLERDEARAREVRVVGLDRRLDIREVERAVRAVRERLRLDAAEHRAAAGLIAVRVRLLADDVLLAALAMAHQRGEVRLRPAREKQRRFEAEQLGRPRLQAKHRRVVAEDVVPDLGRRHGGAHRRAGPGDRIAAQIDHGSSLLFTAAPAAGC